MLDRLLHRLLHEDEEEIFKEEDEKKQEEKYHTRLDFVIFFVLVGLAAVVRLYFLFVVENPQDAHVGWYEDAYHHWQIAYLSYAVGFKHGFLRLWDFKGMEYFWGLLHPLVLGGLMRLFATTSIVVSRLLSLVCGSISIGLVYLLTQRFLGRHAGVAASLITIANPVAIFSDASGMQEPLGIMLLLGGLVFWPDKPYLSGIGWILAGMVRAEYWLLGLGLLFMMFLTKERFDHKVVAVVSYFAVCVLYMKYLLDKTGNAVYPIWWNFIGNAVGAWQKDIEPTPEMLMVKGIYIWILLAVVVGLVLLLWRRPKFTPFFALGLGNWLILAVTIGLSEYLLSYLPRFWVDRIMLLPYMFVAVWFAAIVFTVFKKRLLPLVGWLLVLLVMLVSQYLWQPIWYWRGVTIGRFEKVRQIAEVVAANYKGGRVLVFEDLPSLTYDLVYSHQIAGENILGQMFDPYFYMGETPYENWGENREIILDWLKEEDIRLIATYGVRERYLKLVEKEPEYFEEVLFNPEWNIYIFEVDQEKLGARVDKAV
jgi:hypothetical protein